MKYAVVVLMILLTGCGEVMSGTTRKDGTNRHDWYRHGFKDGDFAYQNWCGYVEKVDEGWKARAWADELHESRLYHSESSAMEYVERWCKP